MYISKSHMIRSAYNCLSQYLQSNIYGNFVNYDKFIQSTEQKVHTLVIFAMNQLTKKVTFLCNKVKHGLSHLN